VATVLCFVRAPARANERPAFPDITEESGLPSHGKTSGCVLMDLDRDGDLDLLLGRHHGLPEAYRLEQVSQGIPRYVRWEDWCSADETLVEDHHATAVGDYDGDGDDDLYLVVGADRGRGTGENVLLEASERGYRRVAHHEQLSDPYGRGRGGLFVDALGHTRLDLLVLNYKSPFRLFVAVGASGFVDRATTVDGMETIPESLLAASPEARTPSHYIHDLHPVDFDNDGRLDFVALGGPPLALHRGAPDQRFEPAYERIPPQAYLPSPAAATWGDFDGDGWMDLVLVSGDGPDRGPNRLLHGSPEGFVDQATPRAASDLEIGSKGSLGAGGVAALSGDFDQDGRLDLYIVQRAAPGVDRPNELLLQGSDGHFEFLNIQLIDDAGARRQPDRKRFGPGGVSEAALAHDFDGDGDLDLLLLQGAHDDAGGPGGVRLLRNDLATGNWISLRLIGGRDGNREGYGARVAATFGGRTQWRQHWPTQTAGSSMPLPLHFGLGTATAVEALTVHWPSGRTQKFEGLEANRRWILEEAKSARSLD
jgi:hypothetical protein